MTSPLSIADTKSIPRFRSACVASEAPEVQCMWKASCATVQSSRGRLVPSSIVSQGRQTLIERLS